MEKSKKRSLVTSILISAIGVLACMIVVLIVLFSVYTAPRMLSTSQSEIYYRVAEQSSDMNAWMTKHITIAEDLALTARVANMHGEELRTYLHDCILNVSPSVMDCYVSWEDESPLMKCAVFVPADDYVPQSRGWYKAAVAANGTIITDPYVDAFTGKIVITVATLVKDAAGNRLGCAGLDIDVTELLDLANEMKADENGYAILVDAAGNIVVDARHSYYSHRLENGEEASNALNEILPFIDLSAKTSDANFFIGKDSDGVNCLFPVVELGNTGWKLIYAADYSDVRFHSSNATLMITVAGIIGMIVGAIFLKIKFSRRLAPLNGIVTVIDEMKEGKLEHTYPETANDEIGTICSDLKGTNAALRSYVTDISHNLSKMATGDFRCDFGADYKGDFAPIEDSINGICTSIGSIIKGISDASDQFLSGSEQVSTGAQGLSRGTTEQAASIERLSATIREVTAKVESNAQSAEQAMNKTNLAGSEMQSATEKMNELVKAMSETKECSDQIGKIIKSIEDIAFQTNILALNAAVEAARAGAAGKGFAVVADEVRNLAAKSAEAAANTNTLIENTIESVGRGDKLVKEVAEVMNTVSEAAGEVAVLNTGICDSSAALAGSIAEINRGVEQISGVVQTNAATAQESAAASEELSGQADTLKKLVDEFTLR